LQFLLLYLDVFPEDIKNPYIFFYTGQSDNWISKYSYWICTAQKEQLTNWYWWIKWNKGIKYYNSTIFLLPFIKLLFVKTT